MLLDESSGNLEFIARPTLDDDVYEIEVENIENVDDLTDKIIEDCEMEILSRQKQVFSLVIPSRLQFTLPKKGGF